MNSLPVLSNQYHHPDFVIQCHGRGPQPCRLMFIGEAPGKMEVKFDYPFYPHAPSGKEFGRYLSQVDINRDDCYITNYCKRFVENPADQDFKPYEAILAREIKKCHPEFIVPLGRWATQFLLGNDVSMDECHGLAHWNEIHNFWVIPCYHPAAGIHRIALQTLISNDIHYVAEALKGNILRKKKDHGLRLYHDAKWFSENIKRSPYRALVTHIKMSLNNDLAVDTEGSVEHPYCLSYSYGGGIGVVLMPQDITSAVKLRLERTPMILHNALHDLRVLKKMGCCPSKFTDTMVMAHLLGTEPQGLKPLAKRLCGMEMSSYSGLLASQNEKIALKYLKGAGTIKWPLPAKIPRIDKNGTPGYKQPRGLNTLITRALKDHSVEPIDIRKRWNGWPATTRLPAETRCGPLPVAELKDLPTKVVVDYAARDADATVRIAPLLRERIHNLGLGDVLDNDLGAMTMIADMMDNGIQVDQEYLAGLSGDLKAQKMVREMMVHYIAPNINVGSADQVADLLFKTLKLTPGKLTPSKKRYTVDDATLQSISHEHPIVGHILKWREAEKLLNTYAEKLPGFIRNDRIYPKFRITGTPSGRLTCSEPNLMAIPTRTAMGKKIRAGFVAPPGRILASWDLSQIEMRVLAHVSNDLNLRAVFDDNKDLHTATAAKIYRVQEKDVTPNQRSRAKNVAFGIVYGISAIGLLAQLHQRGQKHYTIEAAQKMIDDWFDVYPDVYEYMEQQRDDAKVKGLVRSSLGRIRYLPGARSPIEKVAKEAERQAINHPIQTGAAEIMKSIMAKMHSYRPVKSLPILQIHDELVYETNDSRVRQLDEMFRVAMNDSNPLCVPITCGMNSGVNWAELK